MAQKGKKKYTRRKPKRVNTRNMTREQARRYHAVERRKTLIRQRRILVGSMLGIVIVITLLSMRACGVLDKKAKETTLTLMADGSIVFEEVENATDMTKDELETYVKETIDEYNKSHEKKLIKLKKIKTKKDTVYMKTTYKTPEDYKEFTGLDLFVGTVSEATAAGYDLSDLYVKVTDGKKTKSADVADVLKNTESKLLIIDQNINVVMPGTITYVTDTATTVDGQTVTIKPTEEGQEVRTIILYKLQ